MSTNGWSTWTLIIDLHVSQVHALHGILLQHIVNLFWLGLGVEHVVVEDIVLMINSRQLTDGMHCQQDWFLHLCFLIFRQLLYIMEAFILR